VSMPNHRKIIEAVFYSRDWDIGSHEGLRDYTEAAVTALHAHDPNWGHLRKNPGQTQIDGRGEDSALYRVPEANGKLRAVDFLIDAQLSTARPAWQPDPEPYYTASDWFAPLGRAPLPPIDVLVWTEAHRDALLLFKSGATTQQVAEQFAYYFEDEEWGTKSAGPDRPVSADVIARRFPNGRLLGYRVIPPTAKPTQYDLTGQHFIEAQPVNHLGSEPAPVPPPPVPQPPPPAPAPSCGFRPVDLSMVEGLLAALTMEVSALRHDDQALRHQLASVYDELQHARLEIQDARRAMDRELVIDANVKVLGKIGGTVRPA
jgi:hypothetical protein